MKQQLHVTKYYSNLNGPMLWMFIMLGNLSNSWLALVTDKQELTELTVISEDVKACTCDIKVRC